MPVGTWQLQEAKQRFSEVVHLAQTDGPQTVTRHGREVVVILDISQYHRLAGEAPDLRELLLDFPSLDDAAASVFEELAVERARQLPRDRDELPA